ncbi:MAG: arsenate reductase (glutaredoxin) [Flavobacteriales bacterium CG03_land_8_20_14_0_80_35_15]|nr:MAG: arsenate reductase (glutaredoxin) [Flavobacteriales bacterium CG03_land_8_20_14_0_80_35_15]
MIKIYHNPRCSKSREGLQILTDLAFEFETIDYFKNPLTKTELGKIVRLLGIKPVDLVRKNEAIWKEKFKLEVLTDEAILQAMADFPNLIERPIVINNGKAVIGRPPEMIKTIL